MKGRFDTFKKVFGIKKLDLEKILQHEERGMTTEEIKRFNPADAKRLMPLYWYGRENALIRYYTYMLRGLGMANEFKYVIVGIFAAYFTLKLTNPVWLVAMFVVACPVLVLLGRWQLLRVSRVSEWVGSQFGSVLGYNQYNLQVRQYELLEEIQKDIRRSNECAKCHAEGHTKKNT